MSRPISTRLAQCTFKRPLSSLYPFATAASTACATPLTDTSCKRRHHAASHITRRTTSRFRSRSYYTATTPDPAPYPPLQTAILTAAHAHIPTTGFTVESMQRGAIDAGYLPATITVFPQPAFELVLFHLIQERLALKDRVQFPTILSSPGATSGGSPSPEGPRLGLSQKIRALIMARLMANEPVIHKLPEALALMSLLGNIGPSVAELARLVDEMWYLAGDKTVDVGWYTKRGMLAGVYASAEVYMTQDRSNGFHLTQNFVDRRLEDVAKIGGATSSVGEWVGFTGLATVNVLRSWGMRI